MTFATLDLSQYLQNAIQNEGYEIPTPIQVKVIPAILKCHDIMAKAETGSGKSASFVLPILELLSRQNSEGKAKIKVLILAPTRELSLQIANLFYQFGAFLPKNPKVVCLIGGEHIGDQLLDIQSGCDIITATPGRLLDIIDKKQINLSFVEFFVLDEADKMLDLGFAVELELILQVLPKKRQNLLFSATYPSKMLEIASKITKNPMIIDIVNSKYAIESVITQRAIEVNVENRSPLLRYIIQKEQFDSVLVFMANKRSADNIAAKFRKHGFLAESFHGDLTQEERIYTLECFKKRKIQILFSTDIAARGLDVKELSCVVNFDLPRSPTDYIHRIGRTGRAGKLGMAISFISHENKAHFALIEKRSGIKIQKEQISGFELIGEDVTVQIGGEPIKGKRKSKKDKARELMTSNS